MKTVITGKNYTPSDKLKDIIEKKFAKLDKYFSDDITANVFFQNPGGRTYYGLGVDPVNSDVYVADAVDYMQSGVVYRLNATGEQIDKFTVGIIPNGFCFK